MVELVSNGFIADLWCFPLKTCSVLDKKGHQSFNSFHLMSCSTSPFQTKLPLRLFWGCFCTPVSCCPTSYLLFWSWWSSCTKVTVVRQPSGISRHPGLPSAMIKRPSQMCPSLHLPGYSLLSCFVLLLLLLLFMLLEFNMYFLFLT